MSDARWVIHANPTRAIATTNGPACTTGATGIQTIPARP